MLQKQQILLQEQTALLQHMHEQQCIASEKLAQQQAMIEALVNENKKIKEQQDMIEMLHTENRRLTRLSKRNSRALVCSAASISLNRFRMATQSLSSPQRVTWTLRRLLKSIACT